MRGIAHPDRKSSADVMIAVFKVTLCMPSGVSMGGLASKDRGNSLGRKCRGPVGPVAQAFAPCQESLESWIQTNLLPVWVG